MVLEYCDHLYLLCHLFLNQIFNLLTQVKHAKAHLFLTAPRSHGEGSKAISKHEELQCPAFDCMILVIVVLTLMHNKSPT